MIKTLLFGSSGSAIAFIKNNNQERSYLAVADNDQNKHGSLFRNLLVISPDEIQNYDYDEIVIVSYWEAAIKEQLINNLKIPLDKIVTPDKKLLKPSIEPFQDPNTLLLAKKLITVLCGKAKQEGIPLHIDYGTLLGIVRGNELISWDDDIDLAAINTSAAEVEKFIIKHIHSIDASLNWTIKKTVNKANEPMALSLAFESKYDKYKNFEISIAYKEIKDNKAIKLSSLGQWYTPANHVEQLDTIIWEGTELLIPSDVRDYLTFTYGAWETVKRSMTVAEGCSAIIPFEVFEDAQLREIIIL